jgi:hypothetical protein
VGKPRPFLLRGVTTPPIVTPLPPVTVEWAYPSPSIGGIFRTQPKGVILHGSRSGRAISRREEYEGTRNFARGGANGLGWNITCGEDIYAVHLASGIWGWNAGEHSSVYLGCEFAQAVEIWDITDAQVRAFAHWIKGSVLVRWPDLDLRATDALPMHSELAQGIRNGKSDVFFRGSARGTQLRARIRLAIYGS